MDTAQVLVVGSFIRLLPVFVGKKSDRPVKRNIKLCQVERGADVGIRVTSVISSDRKPKYDGHERNRFGLEPE